MDSEDQRDYHQKRAEQELELAQSAERPEVVAAHYRLAELHLEQAGVSPPENDAAEGAEGGARSGGKPGPA